MKKTQNSQKTTLWEASQSHKKVWAMVLFVFISLFLIGSVSAMDWDNVKRYDKDTKIVTIKNAFGLPLIGSVILDAKLDTPQNYKVGAGYGKVAQFTINSQQDYNNILGQFELYDKRNNDASISRQIDVKYLTIQSVEIDDFKTECSEGFNETSKNITQICKQIKIGTHFEDREVWLPFDNSIKTNQQIIIGLFTDVQVGDRVEWIPTIAGVKVNEWAEWTGNLNVNLLAYYPTNEISGDMIDILHGHNATCVNTPDQNIDGKIEKGIDFDAGSSEECETTNTSIIFTDLNNSITIGGWYKPDETSSTGIAISRQADHQGRPRMQLAKVTTSWRCGTSEVDLDQKYITATGHAVAGTWQFVVCIRNATHISVWVNATCYGALAWDGTNIPWSVPINWTFGTRGDPSSASFYNGSSDEQFIYNRALSNAEIIQMYNGGAGITYGQEEAELEITLLSPGDNTNFTTNTISFSANVSDIDAVGIQNVTISVYNLTTLIWNETNTSTLEGVYNFSDTFIDGDYDWNVTAYDDDNESYSSSTRSFSIDTTNPVMNISYPNETITFHQLNTNLSLNWSINDTHLDSCWFNWNSSNVSVTCSDNSTTFNITDGTVKTLTFYANDTFGNEANHTVTWNYRLFLNYEIYDASILEGLTTMFLANFLTNGSTITLANLSYNSSGNTGTINNHGGNNFTVMKTITVPSVNANTNISFYWNITQGTMYYALDAKNQTILNLEIDNCTVNSLVLYNFTIVDERTQTKLTAAGNNTDAKVDLEVRGFGTTTLLEQFNKSYSQINPFAVCFNSTEGQFNIDVQIQYDANGYEVEFYHIQNATINSTNFPTNITLYDLNSTQSQLFKLIVKDSSFLAIEDALVEVHRKYIDEGVFKIVEIPRTDGRGETAAHLIIQDAIYNFVIKKYGVTITTFENVIAVCQTPLVTPCVIDFNAFAETVTVPDFEEAEDFLFTLGFNSSSRVISSVFSIPSGEQSNITIYVLKEDALGTSICTDTLTSSSGTLNCDVGTSVGNSTVLAKIYKDGNLQAQGQVKLDNSPISIYGGVLVILALFIMMTLIGAGISDNPVYTVLFLMVGVILLFALNLVASNGFIGASATILWLIVAIILIIIKGGRRS